MLNTIYRCSILSFLGSLIGFVVAPEALQLAMFIVFAPSSLIMIVTRLFGAE